MAKPNLALIPSTIGTKVYSVLPSDGSGDFAFGRSTVATRVNSLGLIEEVPSAHNRLNYDLLDGKVYGCPNLLLEPQRTNKITYSEEIEAPTKWETVILSTVINSIISPDGTLNGTKLIRNTAGTGTGWIRQRPTVVVGENQVVSIFGKIGNKSILNITYYSATGGDRFFNYDLSTQSITGNGLSNATYVDSGIEYYGNGWYRCFVVVDAQDTSPQVQISVGQNRANSQGDFIYLWGAQVEQGSYPTSYIKTTGSTTTRLGETATGSGNAQTFNDSEGVLMAEISALANDGTDRAITISDGTSSNRVTFFYSASNNINYNLYSGGSLQSFTAYTVSNIKQTLKFAIKYKLNDIAFWVNGFEVATDSGGNTPIGLNKLHLATFNSTAVPLYGKTKQIQYFNTVLADTQLEQLTSWVSFQEMANGQLYTIE